MKTTRIFALNLLAAAGLAGCAGQPTKTVMLDEARSDYQSAEANPRVRELASLEMKQAADALSRANQAAAHGDKPDTVDHLAYLARQRIAIAQAAGEQKAAEAAVADAETARDKVRLAARTVEADRARLDAQDAQARARQLESQIRDMNAQQTPRGLVVTIGDVLFDTGRADLKAGALRNLEKLTAFLQANPQRRALSEGFTDSVGNANTNLELSGQRANAVRAALINMGIDPGRLEARGYGEAFPVASNATSGGRQMNRRVEIVLSDDSGNIPPR